MADPQSLFSESMHLAAKLRQRLFRRSRVRISVAPVGVLAVVLSLYQSQPHATEPPRSRPGSRRGIHLRPGRRAALRVGQSCPQLGRAVGTVDTGRPRRREVVVTDPMQRSSAGWPESIRHADSGHGTGDLRCPPNRDRARQRRQRRGAHCRARPFKLQVQVDPAVPVLHVYAQAPSAPAAERLADASVQALPRTEPAQRKSAGQPVDPPLRPTAAPPRRCHCWRSSPASRLSIVRDQGRRAFARMELAGMKTQARR